MRYLFGGTAADITTLASGRVAPGSQATAWYSRDGDDPATDLATLAGDPSAVVTSDTSGAVLFYGPDNYDGGLWLDFGLGWRTLVRPVNLNGKSAYEVAVAAGFEGTVEEWLDTLVGPVGPTGPTGPAGATAAALTTKGDLLVRDSGAGTRLPVGLDGQRLVADSSATTGVRWDTDRAGNMLTPNQASCGDTLSSTAGFAAVRATITRVTDWAAQGAGSILITATGADPVIYDGLGAASAGSTPVTPGQEYTITAVVRGIGTAIGKGASVRIRWNNVSGSQVSLSDSPTVTLSDTPQTLTFTATAPSNAVFAGWQVHAATVVSGEQFWVDSAGIWRGAGGTWAMPGERILGTPPVSVTTKGDLLAATGPNALARVPVGAAGRVLVADPSAATGVSWDDVRRSVGNMLPLNYANGGEDGTTTGVVASNYATVVSSTAAAWQGSRSFALTFGSLVNGVLYIGFSNASTFSPALGVPVEVGRNYTYTARMKASAGAAGQIRLRVFWYDSSGVYLGASYNAAGVATAVNDTGWTELRVAGIAPANAVYAGFSVLGVSGWSSGNTVYIDGLGFWVAEYGGGKWALPGEPIQGLTPAPDSIPGASIVPKSIGADRLADDLTETLRSSTAGATFYAQSGATATTAIATVVLEHPPLAGSVVVFRQGLALPLSAWSLSYRTLTVTGCTSGDALLVQYAHADQPIPPRVPAIVSTPVVQDEFTRAASAVTMGSADTGQVWTPNQSSVWGISADGKAYRATPGSAAGLYDRATISTGVSDVEIEGVISGYVVGAGLIVRDGYTFEQTGLRQINVGRIAAFRLGQMTAGQSYRFRIRAVGDTISVYRWVTDHWELDIGPVSGCTYNQTSTVHGLYMSAASGSANFDDIKMWSVVA